MNLFRRKPKLSIPPLFMRGDFTLHSGKHSGWKIECDALTDHDWCTLAFVMATGLPKFRDVYGVPRGGMKLAAALSIWCDKDADLTLVVDDVWTTGGSMRKFIETLDSPDIIGAVVFSRASGHLPGWVIPLFTLNPHGIAYTCTGGQIAP